MKANHLLSVLALALIAGAVWAAMVFLRTENTTGVAGGPGTETVAALPQTHLAPVDTPAQQSSATTEDAREVVTAPVEETPVTGWSRDELGGLTGRVVEEDGTPVVAISVALLQVDANLMLAGDWLELGEEPPRIVLETTATDAEGRFRLGGAYDGSFQGLGIDMRGPRSTVRVVDTQLPHGQTTDIGDIVLPAGCSIHGRVVDAAGQPVAGARVRVFPKPPEADLSMFLQVGVQDFRSDCSIGIASEIENGGATPVIDLPPPVRAHLDDLPIPTALSDASGEYRFEHVPVGELIQGVDKPDLVGVSRVVTTVAGENELEDATLTAGRTIQGVVVDDSGDPLEGVEVLAGSEFVFGQAGILHPAGVTGPDGRFTLRGCPETGYAIAVARRGADERWVGGRGPADQEVEVELLGAVSLTVHAKDAAGEPVAGARVTLEPAPDEKSGMDFFMEPLFLLGAQPRPSRFVESAAGDYVCDRVTPGSYLVHVRPVGLATVTSPVVVEEGLDAQVNVTCPQGQTVDVAVVDLQGGAGVAGARVSLLGSGGMMMPIPRALAVGRTGSDGHVKLGPVSMDAVPEQRGGFMPRGMQGYQVLVQHPSYADTSVPIEPGQQQAQVPLTRGGEIHGTIQWGGAEPQSIYMIVLEGSHSGQVAEMFSPPRLARSDLHGAFQFTHLLPGSYTVEVYDRFLGGDPVQLLLTESSPTLVHRQRDVLVEAAGRVDLVIDLSPSGRGQTARVAGTVFCDSRAVAGARVQVYGQGGFVSTETDEQGRYETPEFLALGEMRLDVEADMETSTGVQEGVTLHQESFTPTPQSVYRIDVSVLSRPVKVHVVDASGAGIAHAQVTAVAEGRGGNQSTQADEQGQAELALFGDGHCTLRASAQGHAPNTAQVDLTKGDPGTVEIVLSSSVPCAGVCDLSAFVGEDFENGAYLWIEHSGDSSWVNLDADDLRDDGRASFTVDGLSPGEHTARLWLMGSGQAEELTFQLPEGGSEALVLSFQPAKDG